MKKNLNLSPFGLYMLGLLFLAGGVAFRAMEQAIAGIPLIGIGAMFFLWSIVRWSRNNPSDNK